MKKLSKIAVGAAVLALSVSAFARRIETRTQTRTETRTDLKMEQSAKPGESTGIKQKDAEVSIKGQTKSKSADQRLVDMSNKALQAKTKAAAALARNCSTHQMQALYPGLSLQAISNGVTGPQVCSQELTKEAKDNFVYSANDAGEVAAQLGVLVQDASPEEASVILRAFVTALARKTGKSYQDVLSTIPVICDKCGLLSFGLCQANVIAKAA